MSFDANDTPTQMCNSQRSFCGECSSMLWNYDDEWPNWIYPYASSIDTELPTPKKGELISIKRDSCPAYVPTPEGAKVYEGYGPGVGIEVSELAEWGVW